MRENAYIARPPPHGGAGRYSSTRPALLAENSGPARPAHGYLFSVSFIPPTAFWTSPAALSAVPSAFSVASPVALPAASVTEPFSSFAAPAIRSLFMILHLGVGLAAAKTTRRRCESSARADKTGAPAYWRADGSPAVSGSLSAS